MIECDEAKRQANLAKHGVDFAEAAAMDWAAALTAEDTRVDYGEQRFISVLPFADRIYVCVWTWRQQRRRLISPRKANEREVSRYEQAKILHR